MQTFQAVKQVLMILTIGLGLAACATNRSVIPISAPVGEQPKSTSFAKITEVRDLRPFSINPSDPSQPSIGNDADIQNAAVTSRAVARKRNSFGMAMGDVMLAENASVAGLVRASAKKALQDKGYVVVDEGAANSANALSLAIDVEQFWSWMQPGFTTLTFTFNSTVILKDSGGLLLSDSSPVRSQAIVNSAFGTESIWAQSVQNGVNNLTEDIKQSIKPAAAPPAISQSNPLSGMPGS